MSYIEKNISWSECPLGTKAEALIGGYWIKTKRGWNWPGGGTFPTPGGDATGRVEFPRDLVFATHFPDWHPRKGEPTYFADYIRNHLYLSGALTDKELEPFYPERQTVAFDEYEGEKIHTARKGHDWKVGDWFRPVTPDGVEIAPPMQLTWVREMSVFDHVIARFFMLSKNITIEQREAQALVNVHDKLEQIAANDGLSTEDFIDWFPKPFDGQLFGWTEDPYNL